MTHEPDFVKIDALVQAARKVLVDFFAHEDYRSDENHWRIEHDAAGMIEITVQVCNQSFGATICGFTYAGHEESVEGVIEEAKQLLVAAFPNDADVKKLLGIAT